MRQTIVAALFGVAVALAALMLWRNPSQDAERAAINADRLPTEAPSLPAPTESIAREPLPVEGVREPNAADAAPVTDEDEDAPSGNARGTPEARVALLVDAGFERARAEEIVGREAELRRAAAYREFESTGSVRALTGSAQLASETGLRAELDDDEFERYLTALGRPTRVAVVNIAADSPAANAGLMPGDEVLAYGGQRVFNLRELNDLAVRRSAGETVAATVVRDGQTLQLYVTGGPLGLMPPELR